MNIIYNILVALSYITMCAIIIVSENRKALKIKCYKFEDLCFISLYLSFQNRVRTTARYRFALIMHSSSLSLSPLSYSLVIIFIIVNSLLGPYK